MNSIVTAVRAASRRESNTSTSAPGLSTWLLGPVLIAGKTMDRFAKNVDPFTALALAGSITAARPEPAEMLLAQDSDVITFLRPKPTTTGFRLMVTCPEPVKHIEISPEFSEPRAGQVYTTFLAGLEKLSARGKAAPSSESADLARQLFAKMIYHGRGLGLTVPHLNSDGDVLIEWASRLKRLSVTVSDEGVDYVRIVTIEGQRPEIVCGDLLLENGRFDERTLKGLVTWLTEG